LVCDCSDRFYGENCQNDLCDEIECLNGNCSVILSDGAPQPICDCDEGFEGENCQTIIVCKGNPCQNDGACFIADLDNPFQECFF